MALFRKKDTPQKRKVEYLRKFKRRIERGDKDVPGLAEWAKADLYRRAMMEAGGSRQQYRKK